MNTAKMIMAFTAASLFLAGCALPRSGKDISGQFPMEIISTHPASISSAKLVQEGDSVIVSGTIRKSHEFNLPGSVEILACGRDGKTLAQGKPRITGYTSKRGGVKEARFSERLQIVPTPETYFRLRYNAPASEPEQLRCR